MSATSSTFAGRVARLHAELARDGVPVSDMRRAPSLELQLAGVPDYAAPSARPAPTRAVERLEGDPIVARRVPALRPTDSRVRYFLDGTQRTLPVLRCGLVPVVATIAAAAVLARDAAGRCTVAPGMLRIEHVWLLPRRANTPEVDRLARAVEAQGMTIEDPLARLDLSDPEYAAMVEDYPRLLDFSYAHAKRVRERLERGLLRAWAARPERATDDGWIVVDGRLHVPVRRSIGIVKQFADRYLDARETMTLLGLRPGERTTAFRPLADRWRGVGPDLPDQPTDSAPDPTDLTLWYLRLWDATGLDARHALIRVEAGPEVRDAAQIDELSGWLMAERTPRATGDERWATLLYPVHYLERILKRRLEADTRGWPGG